MRQDNIYTRTRHIIDNVPSVVTVVAASKTRTPEEIREAVKAGIKCVGENYLQEAERKFETIKHDVKWHFIGHLQKNKVRKAVNLFDMIETVDSEALAAEIDKRCGNIGRIMPILIEVNSGRENNKSGVFPEDVEGLAGKIEGFRNIKVVGLMTMGPLTGDAEDARPYFRKTRKIFDTLKDKKHENVEMKYLSMGMTDSYRCAIEEGANIIRIGTGIFGERE